MTDPVPLAAFRFGHGLPLPAGAPTDPEAMLAQLAGPDPGLALFPGPTPAEVQAQFARSMEARLVARKTPRKSPERKAYNGVLREVEDQLELFLRLQIARGLDSPDGLRERLVRFWADHFSALPRLRDQRAILVSRIDHAIRPHVTGRFADLLMAVELHPGLLLGLDQVASVGPNSPAGQRKGQGLNENLAREMIELHTMGVGAGYRQDDVRQLAELLTGLDVTIAEGAVFVPRKAEPGSETVLGQIYGPEGLGPIRAVMTDLARRPETARHLARKLVVHFLSDTPDEALVARMAEAYLAADTALLPMIRVLLNAPAAWEPSLQKARQPFDFMVAALRGLGVDGAAVLRMGGKPFRRMIREPMQLMGQDWENPRGPDGWPEAASAWITPQGLAARITWAMEVPGRLIEAGAMPEPAAFAARVLGDMAGQGDLALWAARSESPREGLGLVLASPAFNRR
ncbi:MAG: DUF1800 domain-containing protein [Gemmobacter sp.]|uniref:DUF1800 domain-containing protein n=1 Tax=Gemmobacter sp. TaxID=1898957 RepID=UPI001A57400A|nr:DUF1800 domain-containing protein [Gemmobacter sp.]MBL8561335.1 DUF1800 domain-containing protein [Gemmobacter sp.]